MKPVCARALMLLCFLSLISGRAASQGYSLCGSLENGFGPFDYRVDKEHLVVVEKWHFNQQVETLVRGNTSVNIGADISYTLRAYPNHHRALMAMRNLARREKVDKPAGSTYTVACWFQRAERFQPDDGMVKVLHGIYLMGAGRAQEAVAKLEAARSLDSGNPNVHYNLGLAYLDLRQYDKALESAHRAYAAGFPLAGLRNRLKRAGQWHDSVDAVPETPPEGGAQ